MVATSTTHHQAIRAERLSKRYRIGRTESPAGYQTLREAVTRMVSAPLRPLRRLGIRECDSDAVWALQDVSFAVQPGEAVGVIGRNGAGKSTLLKILSRITSPTAGRVLVRGRLASLLEVGTGFHPELTGRENVYLNASILGMRHRQIRQRFDQIVAFAEVERFIDTPVKRYSSGMYLRLAFAVAAHLDPEILVVDEVLAVGDAEFQKKCLSKMGEVAHNGRTVLFVSHHLSAVQSLCTRAIQIAQGRIVRDGEPRSVIRQYMSDGSDALSAERIWLEPDSRPGNSQFSLVALRVVDESNNLGAFYSSSRAIVCEMEFDLSLNHSALCVGFDLINRDGVVVFRTSHNDAAPAQWPRLRTGRNRLRCMIPPGLLSFGSYFVAPRVHLHGMAWLLNGDAEVRFEVQLDHSESPLWTVVNPHKHPGVIAPCLRWQAAESARPNSEASESSRLSGASVI